MNADTPSVFGLSDDQLRPIVEAAAGESVASFTVSVDHEVPGHYGFNARKLIPTFHYRTSAGDDGQVTLFIKRFDREGPAEAHHYAELSRHDAPIPRMYGSLTDGEGREVLFLEYVGPLSDDDAFVLEDAGRFRKWLALVARFGAVEPSPAWRRKYGQTGAGWAAGLRKARQELTTLFRRARKGDLGPDLQAFCEGHSARLTDVHRLVDLVAQRTADMPMTLTHRDLCPENAGVRVETSEWLVLDIEWIGLAPRFFDAACWLGAPEDVQPRCLPTEELARVFLQEWEARTGEQVDPAGFLRTARDLWISGNVRVDWTIGRAIDGVTCWTEDRDEGRRFFRAQLLSTLPWLLREADHML